MIRNITFTKTTSGDGCEESKRSNKDCEIGAAKEDGRLYKAEMVSWCVTSCWLFLMDFMINQRPKFLSVENPGCIFATFFVNNDLLGPWDPSYSISAEKMTYLNVKTIILTQNLWIFMHSMNFSPIHFSWVKLKLSCVCIMFA